MSMKNSNDTTRNRTHDLPTSSTVPQQTAPPRAPILTEEITQIWRSWDRASWYISIAKPTRCTIFEFLEYHSACFGWSFCPSSGVQDCTHSIRYMSYRLADCLLAGHEMELVCTVLNSWWWMERLSEICRVIINKLENCASSWFYYRNNTTQCMNAYSTRQVS
jgi:hypothetical protein